MKLLIIEDHTMFNEFLVGIAKQHPKVTEVRSVETGNEGVRAIREGDLELVLLDLDLPDMDGFEVAESVVNDFPKLRVVAVSSYCDEFTLYRVLQKGLFGYVDKTHQRIEDLRFALNEVIEWRPYYSAGVHQFRLMKKADPHAFDKFLTDREQEFLCLFGVGLRNEEIAEQYNVAVSTVQTHRRNIMRKLDLGSTSELIRFALTKGFSRVSEIVRLSESSFDPGGGPHPEENGTVTNPH